MGSLLLLWHLAGNAGVAAWRAFCAGHFFSDLKLTSPSFELFSVVFSLGETRSLAWAMHYSWRRWLGDVPGIVKRLTICFYARCLIFDSTVEPWNWSHGAFGRFIFLAEPIPPRQPECFLVFGLCMLLLVSFLLFFENTRY